MAEGKVIIVNPDMFGKDPDSKTAKANEVAKSFGLSDAALAEVEDFKAQLTKHNAWDLPFMGYVNEDGYGYAYGVIRPLSVFSVRRWPPAARYRRISIARDSTVPAVWHSGKRWSGRCG